MNSGRRILDLAGHAGCILLKNGAEIFRVQETMQRILEAYGIQDSNVYVVSNGIFATVNEHSENSQNLVRHVPLGGINLRRIDAVNRVSRRICENSLPIEEAEAALDRAETLKSESDAILLPACGFGCAGFCYLFGGTLAESAAALVIGMLLYVILTQIEKRNAHFTQYILGSAFVALLSGLSAIVFPSLSYDRIMIGAIIPMVPGVVFTTSIREFFNGDYLSGVIHLVCALLTAACIGLGVCAGVWFFRIFGVLL